MLEYIEIRNFRCFRNVDVPLKPLTVLIGQNNTGKSAFLSAFHMLGTNPKQNTPQPIDIKDRYGLDPDGWPSILGTISDSNQIQLRPNESNDQQRGGGQTENRLWVRSGGIDAIAPINLYGAKTLIPKMECPAVTEKEGVPLIDDSVSNVVAVLDALLREDRVRFDRIVADLRDLIPGLQDIQLKSPDHKNRRLDLVLDNGQPFHGSDTSYGVRLMVFFVTLANHPTPPKTILLEEPENGVHPKRLEDILKLLRGLSEGRHDQHPTQVVITTHSPYLLDFVDVKTDQVLVAQREADGQRIITGVDAERLKGFLDEFMLGEIWINQEEHGLVSKQNEQDE